MIRTTAARLFILFIVLLSVVPAIAQTTNYRISWAQNPEPDIDNFIIYRSLDPYTNFIAIDTIDASMLEYIDTGREEGIRYYYKVSAVNISGLESLLSNPVSGLTIPQDASPSMNALCDITSVNKIGDGSYGVNWSTQNPTTGYVQYGLEEFDSMSDVDNTTSTSHVSSLTGLLMPASYLMRAVSYDNSDNMTISMVDTLTDSQEDPVSPATPLLSIFPIPFLPDMGNLTITNLPEGGSVAVYSANGLEIWNTNIGTETTITWNGKNGQVSPVMSGVYYVVTKDSGNKVINKRPIMIVN